MLLRQKKNQEEDQNWCVILSAVPSEFDRKRVAEKISHVFRLSPEESADLVSNTPIIILDNLTRAVAVKLKDFLKSSGAESALTNDTFQKRKCYRTVWPEPPNLSFLMQWSAEEARENNPQEMLAPQAAVEAMRTLGLEEETDHPNGASPISASAFTDSYAERQTTEETERWRRECLKLQDEVRELKAAQARFQKDAGPQPAGMDKRWIEDQEQEMKQAQQLLEHANEKYEILKQEYGNARHLYEEKITSLLQDSDRSKRKMTELTENAERLQKEKQILEDQMRSRAQELLATGDEVSRSQSAKDEKIVSLTQALEEARKQMIQLTEQHQRVQFAAEENRKAKVLLEEKGASSSQVLEQFKRQLADTTENLRTAQSARQTMEVSLAQNRQERESAVEKLRQSTAAYEERLSAVTKESDLLKRQSAEWNASLSAALRDKQMLEQRLAQREGEMRNFQDETSKTTAALEQRLAKNSQDVSRFEIQLREISEKAGALQKSKEQLELTVNTQSEQIAYWHEQYNKLAPQFETISKRLHEETLSRETLEVRNRELEKNQDQLLQQLQEKNVRAADLERRFIEFEEQIKNLQEAFQVQEKGLYNTSKLLETRDRELEAARRQIRDVNAQMEHRETIQKRNQLTQTVAEKEAALKKIVHEQQKIESEIKERETSIRTILSQQEAIEKEIIEAKQAQRHLTELAKRDQQQKTRIKIGSGLQDSAADLSDEKPSS